ncbi:hypothetical protein OAQ08_01940 [Alphaproteobacteria bacterium]|nr:hypothetical protein [Alphaproteobacteria bacterium]
MSRKSFISIRPTQLSNNHQKKNIFIKEEISNFLINLGQKRADLQIDISIIVEKLKFPTGIIREIEKGNISFVQYPLNYFFSRQYAYLLGLKFPENFKMQSFNEKEFQ